MHLNEILIQIVQKGASDLHLKHGIKPVIRRHGELEVLDKNIDRLTGEKIKEMAYAIMSPEQRAYFEKNHEVDMGYGVAGLGRFRVNVFQQRGTLRMVVRSIPMEVPSLNQLGLPKIMESIANFERGLLLVTGVTGSGKSTTMASLIDYINQTKRKHIITIEDPIEYIISDRKSIISQRELGSDTLTFSSAIRSAMRQDPDVILLGEIRDRETMDIALLAAETGHLVISTLHTADARETLNRILVYYEPHEQLQMRVQLASVMRAVVSQRLAKRKDNNGVIPAVEVMLNTTRIREMMLSPEKTNRILDAIEEGHVSYGMQSFDQSLMQLLTDGIIDYAEALQLSTNPDDFALRAKGVVGSDPKWAGFDKEKNKGKQDDAFWKELPRLELETLYRPSNKDVRMDEEELKKPSENEKKKK
jgi:twitching motility protein PilT